MMMGSSASNQKHRLAATRTQAFGGGTPIGGAFTKKNDNLRSDPMEVSMSFKIQDSLRRNPQIRMFNAGLPSNKRVDRTRMYATAVDKEEEFDIQHQDDTN